jgi:hypothetical protein
MAACGSLSLPGSHFPTVKWRGQAQWLWCVNFMCQLGWATVLRYVLKWYSGCFCEGVLWMRFIFNLVDFEYSRWPCATWSTLIQSAEDLTRAKTGLSGQKGILQQTAFGWTRTSTLWVFSLLDPSADVRLHRLTGSHEPISFPFHFFLFSILEFELKATC